jgi:hypothetical protein
MREAQAQFSGGDGADEFCALFGARAVLQKSAAKDHSLKIGFERERLAELLHHHHRLDRAAAEAPVAFRKGRAEQAHLGVVAPQRLAKPLRSGLIALAGLEPVALLHQPRDIVAQQFLFAAELEVHLP